MLKVGFTLIKLSMATIAVNHIRVIASVASFHEYARASTTWASTMLNINVWIGDSVLVKVAREENDTVEVNNTELSIENIPPNLQVNIVDALARHGSQGFFLRNRLYVNLLKDVRRVYPSDDALINEQTLNVWGGNINSEKALNVQRFEFGVWELKELWIQTYFFQAFTDADDVSTFVCQ